MCVCLYYNLCNTLTATLLLIKMIMITLVAVSDLLLPISSHFFPENEDVPLTGR